jgi:hypothetical protein
VFLWKKIKFVSRGVVNYVYDINVITDNINSISVIYYIFMAYVSILVCEVVSYFNFPSISYEVFNISSIRKGVSAILIRFLGSENKIVVGVKSIDCKYRDNSTNKLLNILYMNESDREDFKGGSKEESGGIKEEEIGVNKSSKEIKLEDVSDKEVRRYWYNMSKWGIWNRENGGSGCFRECGGPYDPFNKEEYVRWLNGKGMNVNKNIHDRVYDSNTEIKSSKEREVELFKYWRFFLMGEGDPKSLPINTTSNELINSRYKVLQEIKQRSKEREVELLNFWRFKLKGEGVTKSIPFDTTSNELIYTRHKVVQEILKSSKEREVDTKSFRMDTTDNELTVSRYKVWKEILKSKGSSNANSNSGNSN